MINLRTDVKRGDPHILLHNNANAALSYEVYAAAPVTSASLQAALNSANGRTVVLPAGDIYLAAPVRITARERSGRGVSQANWIRGQGINITNLYPQTTAFEFDVSPGVIRHQRLSDFNVIGGDIGLHIYGNTTLEHTGVFSACTFERLFLEDQRIACIKTECQFLSNKFDQVDTSGTWNGKSGAESGGVSPQYGLWMTGDFPDVPEVVEEAKFKNIFRDCAFRYAMIGFYLDSRSGSAAAEITLDNCNLEGNWLEGWRLNRARNVYVNGGYLENNNRLRSGRPNIYIEAPTANYPVHFLSIKQLGGSYDLSAQQPQVFLYAEPGGLESAEIQMSSIGGYEVHGGGAVIDLYGPTGSPARNVPEAKFFNCTVNGVVYP